MAHAQPDGEPAFTASAAEASPERAHAEVWYCTTGGLEPGDTERVLWLLSSDERRRHDRLAFARDRRDYVVAHALLRIVLAAHLSVRPQDLVFAADADGKPALAGRWREGPSFSLSHTRGLVTCLIGSGPVGVDVEAVDPSRPADVLSRRFFAPGEAAAIEGCPADERPGRFTEIWVLKEALFKALGRELERPLDGVAFHVRGRRRIDTRSTVSLGAYRWAFLAMGVSGTYRLGAAVGGDTAARAARIRVSRADPLAVLDGSLTGPAGVPLASMA